MRAEPSRFRVYRLNHSAKMPTEARVSQTRIDIEMIKLTLKQNHLLGVGFEPTHLAILELESSALDHSAIQPAAN